MREDETRARLAGIDVAWHGETMESRIHCIACLVRVAAAIHVGNLQRREVFRVGADRRVAGEGIATVFHLQPDRLDALVVEIEAEDAGGFVAPGNGCGDVDRPVRFPLGASEEGARIDGLVQVGLAATAGQPGGQCHGY